MHIIIGIVTAVAGLIWALYRLQNSGVDLNSFNPFYWIRRRNWQRQLSTKPLHRLDNSMEAAAVLVVAMAQLEGEVTREQKRDVLQLFIDEFGLGEPAAQELYKTSSYLLKDVVAVSVEVKNILAPTLEQFEARHKQTLLSMLQQVSAAEGSATKEQMAFLQVVSNELTLPQATPLKW